MKQFDSIKNNAWIPTEEDLQGVIRTIERLPTADAAYEGFTYLLTGSQQGFSTTHVYKCVEEDGSYYWKDLEVGKYGVGNCTNFTLYTLTKDSLTYAYLRWKDPADVIVNETELARWHYTTLVMCEGHEPLTSTDPDAIVIEAEIKERDKYSQSAIKVQIPDITKTYYFKLFPVSFENVETNSSVNCRNTTENFVATLDRVPMAGKVYMQPLTGESGTAEYVDVNHIIEHYNGAGFNTASGKAFADKANVTYYKQMATRQYNPTTGGYIYETLYDKLANLGLAVAGGSSITGDQASVNAALKDIWSLDKVFYVRTTSSNSNWFPVDYSMTNIDSVSDATQKVVTFWFVKPGWAQLAGGEVKTKAQTTAADYETLEASNALFFEKRSANIDWQSIGELTKEGSISNYFAIGDVITLPYHSDYGYMEFEVVGFNAVQLASDADGASYSPSMTLQAKHLYFTRNHRGHVADTATCVFDPVELQAVQTDDTKIAAAPYFVNVAVGTSSPIYAEAAIGVYNVTGRTETGTGWNMPNDEVFYQCDLPWRNPGANEEIGNKTGTSGASDMDLSSEGYSKFENVIGTPGGNGSWSCAAIQEFINNLKPRDTNVNGRMYFMCPYNRTKCYRDSTSGDIHDLADYTYNKYVRYFSNSQLTLGHTATESKKSGYNYASKITTATNKVWRLTDITDRMYAAYLALGGGAQNMVDVTKKVPVPSFDDVIHNDESYFYHFQVSGADWYDVLVMEDGVLQANAKVDSSTGQSAMIPTPDVVEYKNKDYFQIKSGTENDVPTTDNPYGVTFEALPADSVIGNYRKVNRHSIAKEGVKYYKNVSGTPTVVDLAQGAPVMNLLTRCTFDVEKFQTNPTGPTPWNDNAAHKCNWVSLKYADPLSGAFCYENIRINIDGATSKLSTQGTGYKTVSTVIPFCPQFTKVASPSAANVGSYYVADANGVFSKATSFVSGTTYFTLTVDAATFYTGFIDSIRTAYGALYKMQKVEGAVASNLPEGTVYELASSTSDGINAQWKITSDTTFVSGKKYGTAVLLGTDEFSSATVPSSYIDVPTHVYRGSTSASWTFSYGNGDGSIGEDDPYKGVFFMESEYYIRPLGTNVFEHPYVGMPTTRYFSTAANPTAPASSTSNGSGSAWGAGLYVAAYPPQRRYDECSATGNAWTRKVRYAETMPDCTGFAAQIVTTPIYCAAKPYWHAPNLERALYGNNTWATSYARKYLNGPIGPVTLNKDTKHITKDGAGVAIGYSATISGNEVTWDKSVGAPTTWWKASHPWDTQVAPDTANSRTSFQSFLRGFLDVEFKPVNKNTPGVAVDGNGALTVGNSEGMTVYLYDYLTDTYTQQDLAVGHTLRLAYANGNTNTWKTNNFQWVISPGVPNYNAASENIQSKPASGNPTGSAGGGKFAYVRNPYFLDDIREAYYFLKSIATMVVKNNCYGTSSTDYYNEYGQGTISYDKVTLPSCYQMNAGYQSTNGVVEDTVILQKWQGCQNADRIKKQAVNSMYDEVTYVATSGAYWWLRTAGGGVAGNYAQILAYDHGFGDIGFPSWVYCPLWQAGLSPLITIG